MTWQFTTHVRCGGHIEKNIILVVFVFFFAREIRATSLTMSSIGTGVSLRIHL